MVEAETQRLKEEAKALTSDEIQRAIRDCAGKQIEVLLPKPEAGSHGHAASRIGHL